MPTEHWIRGAIVPTAIFYERQTWDSFFPKLLQWRDRVFSLLGKSEPSFSKAFGRKPSCFLRARRCGIATRLYPCIVNIPNWFRFERPDATVFSPDESLPAWRFLNGSHLIVLIRVPLTNDILDPEQHKWHDVPNAAMRHPVLDEECQRGAIHVFLKILVRTMGATSVTRSVRDKFRIQREQKTTRNGLESLLAASAFNPSTTADVKLNWRRVGCSVQEDY